MLNGFGVCALGLLGVPASVEFVWDLSFGGCIFLRELLFSAEPHLSEIHGFQNVRH
jgi:hypothetical protein